MAYPPKTPTRHRSRSETKTPLSSSVYGANNLADSSNPFIVPSRTSSPVKRSAGSTYQVSEALQRQASAGVIRKGGIESRLDVVTRDYVPPPKSEKRSRSQPSVSVHIPVELYATSVAPLGKFCDDGWLFLILLLHLLSKEAVCGSCRTGMSYHSPACALYESHALVSLRCIKASLSAGYCAHLFAARKVSSPRFESANRRLFLESLSVCLLPSHELTIFLARH